MHFLSAYVLMLSNEALNYAGSQVKCQTLLFCVIALMLQQCFILKYAGTFQIEIKPFLFPPRTARLYSTSSLKNMRS